MTALAIALPNSSHFIYIPVVFILGIVIGFMLGAKATRDEIALGQKKAAEHEARLPRSARRRPGRSRRPSSAKPTKHRTSPTCRSFAPPPL